MPTTEQRNIILSRVGYVPTAAQKPVLDSTVRFKLVAGGERAGKSRLGAADLTSRFYEGKLYWIVGAEYEATKPEFNYIASDFEHLGINFEASKNINPGEIRVEGGFNIVTKSAKDFRKLGMEAPDGILVCEAAQLDYDSYLRLRGRTAEKRGWMTMTGTFEGSLGWYPELFNRWQLPNEDDARSFSIPSWSNTVIFPGGISDPEIQSLKALHSEDWFAERYGGQPCPPKGRVFPEFQVAIHVGNSDFHSYDPALPVLLGIDPGFDHAYAVEVCQLKGNQVVVIDEIYERGLVAEEIITVCQQKPWWKSCIGGAIDPFGGLQHQGSAAQIEIWQKVTKLPFRARRCNISDEIERMKSCLKVNPLTNRPILYINSNCHGLISELGGEVSPLTNQVNIYQWKIDREGIVVGSVPLDKYNDAIKALTYLLVDQLGFTDAALPAKIRVSYIG